jgi:hypothetical protein
LLYSILGIYSRVDYTKYICCLCLTEEEMVFSVKSPYKTSESGSGSGKTDSLTLQTIEIRDGD